MRENDSFGIEVATATRAVVVRGDLDVATVPRFAEALSGLIQAAGTDVIIDMSDVSFVDSTALSTLIEARRTLADMGSQIVLRRPSPATRRLLELSGVASMFPASHPET